MCATVTEPNDQETIPQQQAGYFSKNVETTILLTNNTPADVTTETTRDMASRSEIPRVPCGDDLGQQTTNDTDMHVDSMACTTVDVCSGDQLTAYETGCVVDGESVTSADCL